MGAGQGKKASGCRSRKAQPLGAADSLCYYGHDGRDYSNVSYEQPHPGVTVDKLTLEKLYSNLILQHEGRET